MNPQSRDLRLPALRRFAVAITILNLLGHTVFGFEQAWAQSAVALVTAYATELLLELVDARATCRRPRFAGGWRTVVDFLLSAHITGLAVSMLLYSGDQLGPMAFAAAAATGSKAMIRVRAVAGSRHVFNPSNLGISLTLLLFPWVGIAPPYHFTENLPAVGQWLLPAIIVVSGGFLNTRLTKRLPLILAWLGGFVVQALLRSALLGTPLVAALLPMTGVAFVLYTFYMVTDPGTTPASRQGQVAFGLAVAAVYGMLVALHVVFGLFFALSLVCGGRYLSLCAQALVGRARSRVAVSFAPERSTRLGVPQP